MSQQPEPVPVKPGTRFDHIHAVMPPELCEIHDWPSGPGLCGSFLALIRSRPRGKQQHPWCCVDCAGRLKAAAEKHHP